MAKRIRKRDLIIEFLQLITGIGLKKGKKAAPRFELGIKDLQSSALPLGHAAVREIVSSSADRISCPRKHLLVLCNGHGEDLIAVRILEALHELLPDLSLSVLPLVGEGQSFDSAISLGWLKRIGPSARLPSGGFSNQSFRGLWGDIAAGLLGISWDQWTCVRQSVKKGVVILAVGDLLPLFFAWSSAVDFGFVGTPKSDYTWISGPNYALSDCYHRIKGTEWDPWEYFLMRSFRCKVVAVRDRLTARGLRRKGVKAQAPGNPMMDGLRKSICPSEFERYRRLLLLCGSRMPEAAQNFENLLHAILLTESPKPLAIFVPLGVEPSLMEVQSILKAFGFQKTPLPAKNIGAQAAWLKNTTLVFIGPAQFPLWSSWVEVGLANAGTATEQLVGLGIPSLSLPGRGPQFQKSFAMRQSRLLGGAVIPCSSPAGLAERLNLLLRDRPLRNRLGAVGARRMGGPGGSLALADLIAKQLVR